MKKIIILTDADKDSKSSAIFLLNVLTKRLSKKFEINYVKTTTNQKEIYIKKKNRNLIDHNVKFFKFRDKPYIVRLIAEILLPFWLLSIFILNNRRNKNELIIYYSPSIFLSIFVYFYKIIYKSRSFLILRDHFPEWAINLNLIKNKFIISILKKIEDFQFRQSDIIGIQSKNNFKFIDSKYKKKTIVFRNWIEVKKNKKVKKKNKKEIKILYAGNVGPAQDINFIEFIIKKKNLPFIPKLYFYGRGRFYDRLKKLKLTKKLKNIIIQNEISETLLLKKIHRYDAGLLILNANHKTTNIPGKFLTYIKYNLPIFAYLNKNNELIELINRNKIGFAISTYNKTNIEKSFIHFLKNLNNYKKQNFLKVKKEFNVNNNLHIINNFIFNNLKDNKM